MEDSIPAEILRTMFITNGANRNFSQDMENLIKYRNNEKIKSYVEGINPSLLVDSSKSSLLHLAAQYNNYDIARYLINLKFDVNAENVFKMTPLIVAVSFCKFETAQVLIQADADMYNTKLSGKSVLQLLLNNSSTPNYLIHSCLEKIKSDSSNYGEIAEKLFIAKCPLNIVVSLNMSKVTRTFMEHSGQVDRQQCCAAMKLALKFKGRENVLALLQGGVSIDLTQIHMTSFLDLVCPLNNGDESCLTLISAFFEKVVDWRFLREEDVSRFGRFFESASKNVLLIFLQHNIHIHVKNKFPERDLIIRIFGNHDAESRKLLRHLEFDINSRGDFGFTALHYAVNIGALAEVQTLLNLGADPNSKDSLGRVPLTCAGYNKLYGNWNKDVDSDERKIFELLLLAGADVQISMENYLISGIHLPLRSSESQLLAQFAIDVSLGTPIKGILRLEMNNNQEFREAYETYCQQIEKLKATKVLGSVTLYDIVVADAVKIANRIRDWKKVQAIMRSIDVKQLHFFYVDKLEHSVTKNVHTMDLREKATEFMCEVTGWPDSQYIVLEKILGFLSYKDLLVFDLL